MKKFFSLLIALMLVCSMATAMADKLVMSTEAGFPPYEYYDGENIVGIDVEIADASAKKLGFEGVEVMDIAFDNVIPAVTEGKADIAMAGLTVKPEREEYVTFTTSYYSASQKLIAKADDTTFDSCKTKAEVEAILNAMGSDVKAGCQKGTTGELYIDGDNSEGGYGFPGLAATKMSYDYAALAVNAMINGSINYVIVDNGPAKAIAATVNGQ